MFDITTETPDVVMISLEQRDVTEGRVAVGDKKNTIGFYVMKVISDSALGTIESVLPHCDKRSACAHHTQSHYPDTGPTRLSTKSIMPDTRRISY
ncbi:hypothetical protein ElyMa_005820500 [Elysia marginata]|uniref:Uncharacterized protein n=1 Tax=Elysia marginata TaxID=1093978 RepID=A0AAV4FVK4_9GAST|nr:hypothetical protein ElyMa_005820500 [Elysia marginata]